MSKNITPNIAARSTTQSTVQIEPEIFYGCQLKVPRFGAEGQQALSNASCAIIGIGGLGCPVAMYLASSGIGTLYLYDSDLIDATSINRQILFNIDQIGQYKATVGSQRLQTLNPYIHIHAKTMRINESNWQSELAKHDIIIDCSDNFFSKYLIHDAARILKKRLIQAGIYQSSGQLFYFDFRTDIKNTNTQLHALSHSPCLRCLWQDAPPISQQDDCTIAGVLSVVAGTMGIMQANLTILALLEKAQQFEHRMQIFDFENLDFTSLDIEKNNTCLCANDTTYLAHCKYLYNTTPLEISEIPSDPTKSHFVLIDVRNEEAQIEDKAFNSIKAQHLKLKKQHLLDIKMLAQSLEKDKNYVLVCYKGMRSFALTQQLRNLGITNVQSYVGGYSRLAQLST